MNRPSVNLNQAVCIIIQSVWIHQCFINHHFAVSFQRTDHSSIPLSIQIEFTLLGWVGLPNSRRRVVEFTCHLFSRHLGHPVIFCLLLKIESCHTVLTMQLNCSRAWEEMWCDHARTGDRYMHKIFYMHKFHAENNLRKVENAKTCGDGVKKKLKVSWLNDTNLEEFTLMKKIVRWIECKNWHGLWYESSLVRWVEWRGSIFHPIISIHLIIVDQIKVFEAL